MSDGPAPSTRWRWLGEARASAGFAVRTTAAAQVALLSAAALGLHHTHWAAMTVWLVAQPTRGLLLDKSVLRVAGTLVGAAVGFALLALLPDRPLPLVAGVALWAALCAGASAFVRPARAFGILLAGYTAILLALPASVPGHSAESLFADRVLCTLLGVLVSTAITALFTPPYTAATLDAHLRRLADDVFAFAHAVRATPGDAMAARQRQLVAAIGRAADEADRALPGFLANRRRRRKVRRALRALLALTVESRVAAERPRPGSSPLRALAAPAPIPPDAAGDALVARIRAGALRWRHPAEDGPGAPLVPSFAARHGPGARSLRNHREAAIATAKTLAGMALVAALWAATGWSHGPTMMVSASVFLTLFASNESARTWVTHILVGSACGGAAAALYVLLLPLAASPAATALLAAPFLLAGAFAMARPATAKAAVDFNMVFLLATPPAFASHGDLAETAGRVVAIVVGVFAAALFFHATHEGAPRRVRRLARELLRELARLAGSRDAGEASARRGALADLAVRMAAAAEVDARLTGPAEGAIDLLAAGGALARLAPLREVGGRDGGAGPVAQALERVRDGAMGSDGALALERAAEALEPGTLAGEDGARGVAMESLRDAARLLRRAAARAAA